MAQKKYLSEFPKHMRCTVLKISYILLESENLLEGNRLIELA